MLIGTYASSTAWVINFWLLCDWRPGRGRPDLQMYREMAGDGLPLALALFADQSVEGVQAVVTGRLLGVESLGLFRYSERMAQIPVNAIVDVGANSLFPAYSRIASDLARFRTAYLNALGLVVTVAAAVSGLLGATGLPIVLVVLGEGDGMPGWCWSPWPAWASAPRWLRAQRLSGARAGPRCSTG